MSRSPARLSTAVGPARRSRGVRLWVFGILALLVVWAGLDLYGPRRTDLRDFEPDVVARLDTAMWRSYYDRKPLALFFQLAELMRRQFHMPFLRSHVAAARAARAAFVFKDGHSRTDYRRALPDLVRYYDAIRAMSTTTFDVERTAERELEWWIVHRERARQPRGALAIALADAAAELYRVPAARLMEYGQERTVAMDIRDRRAAAGGVSDPDWSRIEDHLRRSWRSLWNRDRG